MLFVSELVCRFDGAGTVTFEDGAHAPVDGCVRRFFVGHKDLWPALGDATQGRVQLVPGLGAVDAKLPLRFVDAWDAPVPEVAASRHAGQTRLEVNKDEVGRARGHHGPVGRLFVHEEEGRRGRWPSLWDVCSNEPSPSNDRGR